MAIHFVYRTPYQRQFKYYRKFEETTILEWFHSFWSLKNYGIDSFHQKIDEWLGIDVYGLNRYSLSDAIIEEDLPEPQNFDELVNYLQEYAYVRKITISGTNLLQVLTDDDELDLAYYIFDDVFLQQYPEKTAYITQEYLPQEVKVIQPNFYEESYTKTILTKHNEELNAVYFAFFSAWGNNNLYNLPRTQNGIIKIEGISLTNLTSFLATWQPKNSFDYYPPELLFLRSQVMKEGRLLTLAKCLDHITQTPIAITEQGFEMDTFLEQDIEKINEVLTVAVKQSFDEKYLNEYVDNSSFSINENFITMNLYFTEILDKKAYDPC